MGQTAFTVRIDVEVKKMFDNLCKDFCMSANTAFNMFARYSQSSKLLPHEAFFSISTRPLKAALLKSDTVRMSRPSMSDSSFFTAFLFTILSSFFISLDYESITRQIVKLLPKKAAELLFDLRHFTGQTLMRMGKAYLILLLLTVGLVMSV